MVARLIIFISLCSCVLSFHLGVSIERTFTIPLQRHSAEEYEVNPAVLKTTDSTLIKRNPRTIDDIVDVGYGSSVAYTPPTLQEYLEGINVLSIAHVKQVHQLFGIIQSRGTVKVMHSSDRDRIVEALTVVYLITRERNGWEDTAAIMAHVAGVAAALAELTADLGTLVAGILQAIMDDISTDQYDRIRRRLGSESIQLATLYRRLPRFDGGSEPHIYNELEAENRLQMIAAMADDYRALYIRVADRLHTMRGLRRLCADPSRRRRIALEVRHVYAPLAHKMDLMKAHAELEDSAFRILEPEMFLRTRYTQTAAAKAYQDATQRVTQFLRGDSVLRSRRAVLKLSHRIKSKYQLYMKMLRKGLTSPNDVRDALGLRIVVDVPPPPTRTLVNHTASVPEQSATALCYYVIQGLRQLPGWEHARGGFKDYILHAKGNGYQSLHQYIRHLALGVNVEVQVRTRRQHHVAELGGAAHWSYKDSIYRPEVARSELYRLAWRSPAQLQARSPEELFALAREQLRAERVFALWVRDGSDDEINIVGASTVLNLPRASTVAVAAAQLGLIPQQVLVNGQRADPALLLQNGDTLSAKL